MKHHVGAPYHILLCSQYGTRTTYPFKSFSPSGCDMDAPELKLNLGSVELTLSMFFVES